MDNQNSGQIPVYPTPKEHNPLSNQITTENNSGEYEAAKNNNSTFLSITLLVLLLLTFFTPLGAVLFLPMLVVGIIAAFKFVRGGNNNSGQVDNTNPIIKALKVIVAIGLAFVLSIMALIAFVFIGFATGLIKLDFGS